MALTSRFIASNWLERNFDEEIKEPMHIIDRDKSNASSHDGFNFKRKHYLVSHELRKFWTGNKANLHP